MTTKPPSKPPASGNSTKSQLSKILTQAVQTIQAKVNFNALALRSGTQVPELKVQDANSQERVYPLLGDRYSIGRSSRCDIQVRNPVVSQVHFSLTRNKKNPRSFLIKDEKSTNGIYIGKRRVANFALYHGDRFTLGPPELAAAVTLEYYNPPPLWLKILRYSLYGTGGMMSLLILWIGIEWAKTPVYPLPREATRPVVVYADDGTPINPVAQNTHRELKNLADFSPYLPKAVIASEDSRYYWHLGVDPYGIARAIAVNLTSSELKQGASTITQQLARSLFPEVGRQNTAGRKLREMLVALKLEAVYSKKTILKTYLNRVYLGVGSYGFEDAAQFYFEKSAADLSLSEAATLVAILPAPNLYNPVKDYETSVALRNRVINRMVKLGMVSEAEADRARRSRIEVSPNARQTLSNTTAPYFYAYVLKELQALLGTEVAKEGNYIVETGLALQIQTEAEQSLKYSVTEDGSRYGYSQGAIVTLDSETGQIIALVGGADYNQSQFDRATQAKRQPGSTFKMFAYTSAIEQGINPNNKYSCAPVSWKGQEYRGCERSSGEINMYRGLEQSENAVALRVAQDIGLNRVIEMARRFGINSSLTESPGLVLGESEVSVLEMTGAYGALANDGIWHRPHAINRILDGSDCENPNDWQTCREIYSFTSDSQNSREVVSEAVAERMTYMLKQVIADGTGKAADISQGEAGKTGTTDNSVDLWFIGYVPKKNLVTGIWLGNDDNSATKGSSWQAATLWGNYMRKIIDYR
ncbi:FHA modulated glycosyl transferase/transpeptidase [Stanieria cyanosphaera PCC 7437]|uniref:FHA modulated glycosyl transferase/transpeptidase n=1 Tax=Stanieria cyanosphaera (strain ATCC 29371 / PCC 7437) TaxID=111780 RepID=K9XX80_STAC7|nr:PBP1A family penicillin-binding protein [Stanieria cyanosphaera]AFZ37205.1 FHA modulated glycosyl transferase/transpeptidase [Stanieria cyanosphaera PCC 7437]